jgi:hypothetical protein
LSRLVLSICSYGQPRRGQLIAQGIWELVPKGRLNLAQHGVLGGGSQQDPVPQGRLKIGRDAILENLQPSLRDSNTLHDVPRTSVLGLKFLHFSQAEAAPRSLAVLRF